MAGKGVSGPDRLDDDARDLSELSQNPLFASGVGHFDRDVIDCICAIGAKDVDGHNVGGGASNHCGHGGEAAGLVRDHDPDAQHHLGNSTGARWHLSMTFT